MKDQKNHMKTSGGSPRGPGSGNQDASSPRRQHDRKDGTGRGHELEKKHGGGAHNWGKEEVEQLLALEDVQEELNRKH
ncbi:hypothetical protein ACKKBG_A38075 [Auxenochlorella protothecoides x Auxenochlorella symbiontica]